MATGFSGSLSQLFTSSANRVWMTKYNTNFQGCPLFSFFTSSVENWRSPINWGEEILRGTGQVCVASVFLFVRFLYALRFVSVER